MEFLKTLLEALQGPLLTLIQGAVTVAVPFLLWHFNAWVKAKSHDARFHCAMDKLTQHAEAAVLDTAASYTKSVRSTGKWDGDAADEAKSKGMARIATLLGPSGLAEIKGCLGQDEAGLTGMMESAVESAYARLKQDGLLPPKTAEAIAESAVASDA